MIKLSRIWIMFYSDSRQNNITFYTADWKSEMKMPGILVQCQQCQQCAELKWPIIILLTLTFVWAWGKLKLLLSVAIISNYGTIIIRRWRPHIITSGTHTAAPLDSQLLLFYIWQFGLRSGPNSFSEREVLIQFIRSRHTPLSNLYKPVNKRQKKIMLELQ